MPTIELGIPHYGADATTGRLHVPHPTQQRVRQWAREVRAGRHAEHGIPTLFLQHGVNAGGTRCMLAPLIEYLLEDAGLQVLIGRKDFNDLRTSVMRTFFEIIPPLLIATQNVQEHRYVIRARGGTSEVFFRELKDIGGLGSQEFAGILICEAPEISLEMYRSVKRRCRQGMRPSLLLLDGNAPSEGHWLDRLSDPGHPDHDPSLTRIILTSEENWAYMSPAYRKDLQNLPPMYFRRYVLGEVGGLPEGTPVYPAFIERLHVRETSLIPDRPLWRSWDFGLRGTACVWAQQTDSGPLLLHREWCPREIPEEAYIAGVIERTNQHFGPHACRDVGDPAAAHRDPHGVTTLARLRDHGIHLLSRPSTYSQRIPLINKKLCELIRGEPAVQVSPHCPTLIQALSGGYHYPTLTEGQALSTPRDQPFHDQVFSHVANALEYLMVHLYGGTPTLVTEQRHEDRRRRQERLRRRQGVVSF